jgi:hypothetical protein
MIVTRVQIDDTIKDAFLWAAKEKSKSIPAKF